MVKIKAQFQRFRQWAGAHPLLCALVFFALSVAARLALNSRLGIITVKIYPDEFRFLHLAKSIAERGEPLHMGTSTNYQKLLYPLLISPSFVLVKDPLWQLRVVGMINVLTMSSAVFPAALLVKRLSGKSEVLLLTLAAVVLMPEFLYTATIMSEALHLPLCLWAFYIFARAMEETGRVKRPLLFALFGFVLYLNYFTKEVGLVFVLAAAGILVFEGVRDRRNKAKLAQNGLSLFALVFSFWALFLVLRLTLFRGQMSIYTDGESEFGAGNQLAISSLFSLKAILYLPYSAAAQLAAALLSFCVLPVLLPLFGFVSLDEQKKRLYLFSASSLVIMAATVAYTISIRENLWDFVPQLPLRYFFPLSIPFGILCFDFLLTKDKVTQSGKRKRSKPAAKATQILEKRTIFIIAVVAGILLMILIPTFPDKNFTYDYFSLSATKLAEFLKNFGVSAVFAALPWNLFKFALLILLAVSVRLLLRGKKNTVLAMLCCTVLTVSVWDNCSGFQAVKVYKRTYAAYIDNTPLEIYGISKDILLDKELPGEYERLAKAAVEVDRYIESLESLTFENDIIGCLDDKYWSMLETYIPQHKPELWNFAPLTVEYYQHTEGKIQVAQGTKVYYIIVTREYNPFANVEIAYESGPFIVLRNLDPTKLLLNKDK